VQFDGRFSEARADGSLILSAGLSVRGTAGWHCEKPVTADGRWPMADGRWPMADGR